MSTSPVDELLAALPEVGLSLIYLGEHTGADVWGCMIGPRDDPQHRGGHWDGQGETPSDAIAVALRRAGVNVEDA